MMEAVGEAMEVINAGLNEVGEVNEGWMVIFFHLGRGIRTLDDLTVVVQ